MMKMKRSDYCNISSFDELRMVQRENYRALKRAKEDMLSRGDALAESLSPVALLNEFMRCVSPLRAILECFLKKHGG